MYRQVRNSNLLDVDDGPIIQMLLKRLTGRRTVPNVIVDFTSIGGADEISLMDSEGSLRTLLMQRSGSADDELKD